MPRNVAPITLIVAATPSLGIGYQGSLPWQALRGDMAFFKRVTTRVPSATDSAQQGEPHDRLNAVIMGRKTWESIPEKFRPLSKRINVVVTRNPSSILVRHDESKLVLPVHSVEEGLEKLRLGDSHVGRIFCIGGAQIYSEVMRLECADRILRTKVFEEYECDVHFPQKEVFASQAGWAKSEDSELDDWVGEENVGAVQEESGVAFAIEMWKKER